LGKKHILIGDTDEIFNTAAAMKNPPPSALFKVCILVKNVFEVQVSVFKFSGRRQLPAGVAHDTCPPTKLPPLLIHLSPPLPAQLLLQLVLIH
jgi:hypothetical protein